MKRICLTAVLLIMAAAAFGMDFNVDARTDISYVSYIKNGSYVYMFSYPSPEVISAYEKLRLKAKEQIDQVKFDFDGWLKAYPGITSVDFTIDSAYFSFENGPFVFYAGKQRIKWGTGYFWNPVDSLQPATMDIYRPTEDLEGIYAIRAEMSNDIITPSLIITPKTGAVSQDIYRDLDAAVQLYKLLGTCDVFVNYIYDSSSQSAGLAISWDMGIFVLNAQAALKEFREVSPGVKALKGIDVTTEGLVKLAGKSFKAGFCAGLSKTITDSLLVVAEYYRNNSGFTNSDFGAYINADHYPVGFNKKDYFAYVVSYTWMEKFAISLTGLHGLDDGTSFIFPSISYVENPSYDIQLSLLQNLSAKGLREGYSSIPIYNTVELRLNAYF